MLAPIGKDIVNNLNFITQIAQKKAPNRTSLSNWKQDMQNLRGFSMTYPNEKSLKKWRNNNGSIQEIFNRESDGVSTRENGFKKQGRFE